jgi:hypothetical protein
MIAQNPQRTGRAVGVAQLLRPAVTWRHYLGGFVNARQIIAENVEGDARNEVIFVASGKLVASRADDTLLWETAPLGLFRIDGVADFDGDGSREIVATGSPGLVAIISVQTGRVLWRTRPSDFSPRIGEVRIARLDDDARSDLYVGDLASSQLTPRPDSMFGYTFARGFGAGVDDGSQRLWRLPVGRDYAASFNDVLADLDGDGVPELIALGTRYAYLYNGRTGTRINAGGADTNGGFSLGFSLPFGLAATQVVDVDGDGRQDVVCLSNNTYPLPDNSRHVFVLSYDPSRPPSSQLYVRWSRAAPDLVNDAHEFVEQSVADLDGDRTMELVTTYREAGVRTTRVLSAATGDVRAVIPGVALVAVLRLDDREPPTVLVRRGTTLEGYRAQMLRGEAWTTPTLTLPDGVVPRWVDYDAARGGSARNAPLMAPLTGTTARRGVVLLRNNAVEVYDPREGAITTALRRYALPPETSVVSIVPQRDVVTMGPGFLVAQSDGYVVALDAELNTLNRNDSQEFPLRGLRSGGFYSGAWGLGPLPTAGRFVGDMHADVVTVDGRSVLQRIDVSAATAARAPRVRWEWRGARFPLLDDTDGDGARDRIIALEGRAVVARAPDGITESLRVPAATEIQNFTGDVVPLGGAERMVAVPVNGTDGIGQIVAVRGNAVAWRTVGIPTGSSIPGYLGVDRFDGDSIDDLAVTFGTMKLYAGATGALLASSRSNSYAAMPITVRGLAGTITNLFAASGAEPMAMRLDAPVTEAFDDVWRFPRPYGALRVFGAVIQCGDSLRYLQPPEASPRLAIVDVTSYRTGDPLPSIALAGGRLYASEEEARVAVPLAGSLGNVTTTQNLGDGRAAALVGSTDGYLYALDPCASPPQLLWSRNFRAAVGQPILADTDGDRLNEIVVTAADGFLYGVDTQAFDAPAEVRDVAPDDPMGAPDIDETRAAALAAEWPEVPGATGYEYAVFTSGGTPVTRNPSMESNPFVSVGPTVRRITQIERLTDGGRYYVAVRAIGAAGASPEVVSDGTVFRFVRPMRADAGMSTDATVSTDVAPKLDVTLDLTSDVMMTRDTGTTITMNMASTGCGCRASDSRTMSQWFGALAVALACVRLRRSPRLRASAAPSARGGTPKLRGDHENHVAR